MKHKILCLLLLQVIGIIICFYLKYHNITPMSDAMGKDGRWDFTSDFIAVLFIAAPTVWAFIYKIPGWRYTLVMIMLPIVLFLSAFVYYSYLNHKYIEKERNIRMQKFDNSAKVEKVIGIPFPDFEMTKYRESILKDKMLNNHVCKYYLKWKGLPSDSFYHSLDSLCQTNHLWRKTDTVYAFDSIYGYGALSKLVLSIILVKGEEEALLEYDL